MLKQPLKLIGIIFSLIGGLFLAVGLAVLGAQLQYFKGAVPVEATVLDLRNSETMVMYTVDGTPYTAWLTYSSSNLHSGDQLTVYYRPEAPQQPQIKAFMAIFCSIFCGIGGIFFVLGIIFLCMCRHSTRLRSYLLETGTRIDATIAEIGFNRSLSVNGRSPYVIRCQAVNPEDGKLYTFQSDNLWYNPQEFLQNITTLSVYINPNNYKQYTVDTSGVLPEEG